MLCSNLATSTPGTLMYTPRRDSATSPCIRCTRHMHATRGCIHVWRVLKIRKAELKLLVADGPFCHVRYGVHILVIVVNICRAMGCCRILEPQQSCQGICTATNLCCESTVVHECMITGAKQSVSWHTAFELQEHTNSVLFGLLEQ